MSDSTEHKHHGLGFFFGILIALMGLTILTYFTARPMETQFHISTGWFHTPLAVGIATVKAFLVVWFFMHLNEHGSTNKVFFVTSIFFVGLMIAFIMADVVTRFPMTNPTYSTFREMKGGW